MDINELKAEGLARIRAASTPVAIGEVKAALLGKKSRLNEAFQAMKTMTQEARQDFGRRVNELKAFFEEELDRQSAAVSEAQLKVRLRAERIDVSLPGRQAALGSRGPWHAIVDDLTDFFLGLGYSVAEGPEVELDHFNFELLNIPRDHPARDMQDSFFIDQQRVMRSHTSPVQARVMQQAKGRGPIKIICPGKVYRRDEDVTHSHQFGQIEALVVGEDVTMGQLQATLTLMLRHVFGEKREVRFRPSFFPFTEPSVEVDISCFNCQGRGCSICKGTGWIEVLGAGMVHPNVLRLNGFDDQRYQGFAFGLGIDRFAMLKYGIDDIKRFYQNDVDFLAQFAKE